MHIFNSKNANPTSEAICPSAATGKALAMCHAQPNMLRVALCFELPADGSIPEWVQLIPAGPTVAGRDGREWVHDNPDRVIKELQSQGRDLVLDWEHSTELKAPQGDQAPAAGWFSEYQNRNGAIFGKLSPTERGRNSIGSKEYRYISPVLVYEKNTRRIVGIASVALTNRPNLHLQALNHEHANHQEQTMKLSDLLKALGLADDATFETALNAIGALKSKNTELQTALNTASTPSLEKFVPRADYDKLLERANNAEKALSTAKETERNKQIDTEVDAALKAGKITPATVEYHKANCRQEGGLERFREFVKAAPVIGDATDLGERQPGQQQAAALNSDQGKINAAFGNSADDLKKYASSV